MSKSPNILIPALGGAALVLGISYGVASRNYGGERIGQLEAQIAKVAADADAARGIAATEAARAADLALQIEDIEATPAPTSLGDPMPETVDLGLGRPALAEEVAAWNIDIRPDGQGLPEGKGDAWTGEELYTEHCAACHGDFGEAVGRWPVLAGGQGSLDGEDPVKTIGSYWPYLSTVYDYVHRAMPFGNAQSLSDDDVYAITAYLLYLNDLVEDDFELSHENFAEVRLPNEGNFFLDDREAVEVASLSAEVCMERCKESVEITARAAVIDVTPEDMAARERHEAAAASRAGDEGVEVASVAPAEAEAHEAVDAALIADGEKLFRKCSSCHEVGEGSQEQVRSGAQCDPRADCGQRRRVQVLGRPQRRQRRRPCVDRREPGRLPQQAQGISKGHENGLPRLQETRRDRGDHRLSRDV